VSDQKWRVRAKVRGFCGSEREAGDVFDLPPGVRPGQWMEILEGPKPLVVQQPKERPKG
jgi:hypothetical protein